MRNVKENTYVNKFAAVVALAVVIFVIVLFNSSSIKANANEMPRYKYYTCIEVGRNDTLWDIADRYMTEEYEDKRAYIDEVMVINQLTSERLAYGTIICVPYYSSEMIID